MARRLNECPTNQPSPHAVASTISTARQQPDPPCPPQDLTRLAVAPGDLSLRGIARTRMFGADAQAAPPAIWSAAIEPHPEGLDRLILIPYGAASAFEPAIARTPGLIADPDRAVVVQDLRKSVPSEGVATPAPSAQKNTFRVGKIAPAQPREAFISGVERVLGYIRAGDAYQVNLSHRLSAPFAGDALAFASTLLASARPEFGGFMCYDEPNTDPRTPPVRHAIVSLSPELFLDYDPATRVVRTKPMKGTRPIAGDPDELRAAEKDRAELNMIVDLMRNDLGRVATPGTVRVTHPRDIDAHADSVWQATATVEARLRDGLTPADLIAATFPPGSVTGAPKVRAAQIIRELEPHHRGPYCGTLIHVRSDGHLTASVLIRTAHIVGTPNPGNPHGFLDAELHYHVGAGIVADSEPPSEWDETLTKASVLLDALAQPLRDHDTTRCKNGSCDHRPPPARR